MSDTSRSLANSGDFPIFPLGLVAFPGETLPLHIFEPRYRQMMHEIEGTTREFGVVLIARGSEVGGAEQRTSLGTVLALDNIDWMPDGRAIVEAHGTQRIEIKRWLPDDPYPRAQVEQFDDEPTASDPEAQDGLVAEAQFGLLDVWSLAVQLHRLEAIPAVDWLEEPFAASWQVANLAPLGPLDRQRVLQATSTDQRISLITRLMAETRESLQAELDLG